jgi:hypothetical protein
LPKFNKQKFFSDSKASGGMMPFPLAPSTTAATPFLMNLPPFLLDHPNLGVQTMPNNNASSAAGGATFPMGPNIPSASAAHLFGLFLEQQQQQQQQQMAHLGGFVSSSTIPIRK